MDIILQGDHSSEDALESLKRVFSLFQDRYGINDFCEIHLSVTLIDEQGDIVELVDNDSEQVYRVFEVFREGYELDRKKGNPVLQLVVDNTNSKK